MGGAGEPRCGFGPIEPHLSHPAGSQQCQHLSERGCMGSQAHDCRARGQWGLRLHPEWHPAPGERRWFPSLPKGIGSRQGRPGWHRIGESGSFPLPEEPQCGTDQPPVQVHAAGYLRPPCVIIFFFPSSLGLTFADKLALISQNVILQLRAKSSQVLRLNSFSKPSLH